MREQISSKYLFNFTSSIDYLVETLEHSAFSPRYNHEDFRYLHSHLYEIRKVYVLMKCFCDIPFGPLMEKHIKKYGPYGIGLRKDWGLKSNLIPIHYLPVSNENVWYEKHLTKLYKSISSKKIDDDVKDFLVNYFICTKPYKNDDTVFYEREYRYVPTLDNIKKFSSEDIRIKHHINLPNQNPKIFNDVTESNNLKNNKCINLTFNLNDISYLIVENENKIDQIRTLIRGNSSIEIVPISKILRS